MQAEVASVGSTGIQLSQGTVKNQKGMDIDSWGIESRLKCAEAILGLLWKPKTSKSSLGCFFEETQSLGLLYSTKLSASQIVRTVTVSSDTPLQSLS